MNNNDKKRDGRDPARIERKQVHGDKKRSAAGELSQEQIDDILFSLRNEKPVVDKEVTAGDPSKR